LISSNDLPLTKGRYAIIAAFSNGAAINFKEKKDFFFVLEN